MAINGRTDPYHRARDVGAATGDHIHKIPQVSMLREELDGKQPLDARLTALAALDPTNGLVEQTGAASFARRAIGIAAALDIPTRGDADARYDALGDALAALAAANAYTDAAISGTTPADATLSALAAANWVLNALPVGTGADTVSQLALAANTFPGRSSAGNVVAKAITDFGFSLVAAASDSAARTVLGSAADADVVKLTGAQTVAGLKTHTSLVGVMVDGSAQVMQVESYFSSTGAAQIQGRHARGSVAGPSALNANDGIVSLQGRGYGATAMSGNIGDIILRTREAFTDTAQGTQWQIRAVPLTTTTVSNVMLLDTTAVTPGIDNSINLGSASLGWKELFCDNGTINTSDARRKTPVRDFTDAELRAGQAIIDQVGIFQFLAATAVKGDAARLHAGLTVQGAIACLEEEGLDPFAYSFICHDSWDAHTEPAEYEENAEGETVCVREAVHHPAGDKFSFRPNELLLFLVGALRARQDSFECRLASLEGA